MVWQREREIKEFTVWINSVFKKAWKQKRIKDLIEEIKSGILLLQLTEIFLCVKLPSMNKNPICKTERLENIELSLEALREDGVEMPGILAQDIADGDEAVILALLCFLQRHYDSDVFPNGMRNIFIDSHPPSDGMIFMKEESINTEEISNASMIQKCPILHPPTREEKTTSALLYQALDFTPFEKEDISILDWVSLMTGYILEDYSAFKDGMILCGLMNCVSLRSIPDKVIARSSASERIKLALNTGRYELGIQTDLTAADIISYQQQQLLRKYLCLLRDIHNKQIEQLKASARYKKVEDIDALCDRSGLMFESFPDWSFDSQSEPVRYTNIADDRDSARIKTANGDRASTETQRTAKSHASHTDQLSSVKERNSPLSSTHGEQNNVTIRQNSAADYSEESLIGSRDTCSVSLNLGLTASEAANIEKRRKREIINRQLIQMRSTMEEMKARMNTRQTNSDASRSLSRKTNNDTSRSSIKESRVIRNSDQLQACVPASRDRVTLNRCLNKASSRLLSSNKDSQSQVSEHKKDLPALNSSDRTPKDFQLNTEVHLKTARDIDNNPASSSIGSSCSNTVEDTNSKKDIGSKIEAENDRYDNDVCRKDSVNLSRPTMGSMSQVALEVTKLARLSSRRPKGAHD